LNDSSRLYLQIGKYFCQVVDRRIVGSGWLDAPADVRAQEAKLADGWFRTITGEVFG